MSTSRGALALASFVALVLWELAAGQSRGDAPCQAFGSIDGPAGRHAICWQPSDGATVTPGSLLLAAGSTTLRSQALPLRASHLYDIAVTMRRGPGTRIELVLATTNKRGVRRTWNPVWQFPERTRANWLPISPSLQDYVQGFVVPSDIKEAHFELTLAASEHPELAAYAAWELTRLSLVERESLRTESTRGPNELAGGDMETADAGGLPRGWSEWQRTGTGRARVIAVADARHGQHVLRVEPGTTTLLGAGAPRVTRGTAWRISMWVRGRGQVRILAHALSDESPLPKRIGTPQEHAYAVNTHQWQRLEQLWYAEAPRVAQMQVVIAVSAESEMDVDDVTARVHR